MPSGVVAVPNTAAALPGGSRTWPRGLRLHVIVYATSRAQLVRIIYAPPLKACASWHSGRTLGLCGSGSTYDHHPMSMSIVKRIASMFRGTQISVLKGASPDPRPLAITLGDRSEAVASALAAAFHDVPSVEVIQGDLLEVDADAIVSPANSFGDMSGGIDKAIDDSFNGELQPAVAAAIRDMYFGELPVGTAIIIPTAGMRYSYVIVAPTMRIPGSVERSINAYLAMRAVLCNVVRFNESQSNGIRSVLVPGLGTGVGGLTPADAAEQMRTAYDNILSSQWKRILHPAQAPYASRD